MKSRNEYIDIAKGIAIFLVVWGHVKYTLPTGNDIYNLIYSFHMRNHTIFRHDNFIGCLSADKIKMPVRKYFCFNIPVYRNMAEAPSCRSPYHKEYIQTSVSGSPEGLCHLTYNSLSKRR